MTTKFEIVGAHVDHLRNVFFAKAVVVGFLTVELSTSILRRVSKNKVYLCFDITAALPEMIR